LQAASALLKGVRSALKHLATSLSDLCILQAAGLVREFRQLPLLKAIARGHNHLVDVGVDDEIGIVGNHDDLSSVTRRLEELHQFGVNRFWIKVLLRLIDIFGRHEHVEVDAFRPFVVRAVSRVDVAEPF
jgi:hypothetical protein